MKYKYLLLLSSLGLLVACGPKDDPDNPSETPIYEIGDAKAVNGTGLLFSETVGFNCKDASVFEENGERYVIYATSETAKGKQVFAARKATLSGGKWVYGPKNIIFRGSTEEEAWDAYIFQPSVVKGEFTYNSVSYSYLMAYHGNPDGTNYNNSIGFAVSNDVLGSWTRVGEFPVLQNPEIYEGSYGFGSPVLTSVDKHGSLLLTYSFGETLLSGARVKSVNASNLNSIQFEAGYTELPTAGLVDRDDGVITNCGFAMNKDYSKVYIANDGMTSANNPNQALSVEIASSTQSIISSHSASWNSIKKITGFDTIDMDDVDSLGWDEIYSATFVTDQYGLVDDASKLEVVYSTYNEGGIDAKWTAQLCSFVINL